MKRVLVTCQGLPPGMLMNPTTEELLDILRERRPQQRKTDWSPHDEAASRLCVDGDGQIGLPALNLFSCLVKAGRRVKSGRQQISTATSTILPSFLAIEEEFLPFKGDPESSWVVDKRRGTNPNGGEMVCLVRPRFLKWELDVTIQIDDKAGIDESTIKELFRMAGTAMGLGDFRPGKGGPFGRFAVTNWIQLDGSQNGKAKAGIPELANAVA
jgi:hypothetical protein